MLEKLIETIIALIAAINANTAAQKGGAPAAAGSTETAAAKKAREKAEKDAAAAAAGPDVNAVRAAATEYLGVQKDKAAQKAFIDPLNAKYGSARLTEAPADKFGEIIAALKAETEKVKSGGAPAGGDSGI